MTLIDKIKNLTWFNLVELLQDILSNFNKKIEVLEESSNDVFIGINTPVSATQSGIVNNTSLQELGGVDKLINGIRIGRGNGTSNTNSAFGISSQYLNTTGTTNVSVGYHSQKEVISGSGNTSFGYYTLRDNVSGNFNTAVGQNSLKFTTGGSNTGVGSSCLLNNATGTDNTGFGNNSISTNLVGSGNAGFGRSSLSLSTGDRNIGIGYYSGSGISTGSRDTIIGTQSTGVTGGITTGSNNLIVAQNDGNTTGITTGSGNTIIGKVTGLTAALANTVVISDGVGTQRFVSSSTNLSTLPAQTNALITGDGTGKSILTKEYLGSRIGTVAPASATDTGTVGEIRVAAGFIYWCTAPNTWIRAAGITW